MVKQLVKLGGAKAARREAGLFLCDGRTLLPEALAHGADVVTVACAQGMALPPLHEHVRVIELPERLMEAVSPTETAQGLVFTCRLPDTRLKEPLTAGRHLLLDQIQDPGNVGSILRTASAFSVDSVLLGPGCADPFSPKAVRGGMGALFRLPVYELSHALEPLEHCSLSVCAAVLSDKAVDVREAHLTSCVLLLGNEGAGLSEALLRRADVHVKIPMRESCQSLGVAAAAAVLMWEMARLD